MMNIFRRIAVGCLLFMAVCIPLRGNAQKLVISGKGQIANAAYWAPYAANGRVEYLFISDEESFVLPKIKPKTKEIQIVINHKSVKFGKLENDGDSSVVTIKYDPNGNLIEIIPNKYSSGRYQYENGRVINWSGGNLDEHPAYSVESRCIYNKNGFLEKQYHRDGQFSTDLYEYKTDSKGNIISAKRYDYKGKVVNNADEVYQYDGKGRLVTYKSSSFKKGDYFTGDYFRNIEKKWNWDNKGNMISLRVKDNLNGRMNDYEYKFEYDSDNNPILLTLYNHSDITVITEGWEYKYTYTSYPTPEERRRQDSIQKINDSLQSKKQKEDELLWQETQIRVKQIEMYMLCRFLFESEDEFASCVSNNLDVAEKEIKQLIIKKMQYVSTVALSGKELQDVNCSGRKELLQICDMCIQLKNEKSQYDGAEKNFIEHIFNYTESILGDFVTGRSKLNKVYKKTPNSDYSIFLLSYMNGNCVDHQDSNYSLLYYIGLGIVGVAYLIYLYR